MRGNLFLHIYDSFKYQRGRKEMVNYYSRLYLDGQLDFIVVLSLTVEKEA